MAMIDYDECPDGEIIHKIKLLSSDYKYGSALIALMDFYDVSRLADITQEQAEQFYEKFKGQRL
jgi:hypothetical protein